MNSLRTELEAAIVTLFVALLGIALGFVAAVLLGLV